MVVSSLSLKVCKVKQGWRDTQRGCEVLVNISLKHGGSQGSFVLLLFASTLSRGCWDQAERAALRTPSIYSWTPAPPAQRFSHWGLLSSHRAFAGALPSAWYALVFIKLVRSQINVTPLQRLPLPLQLKYSLIRSLIVFISVFYL